MFAEMMVSAANNLYNNRKLVDELNVFPVPDGDTGTNMSLTAKAVSKALSENKSNSLTKAADTAANAALRGARGNSGVILSQFYRGISRSLKGKNYCTASELAEALKCGSDTAYKAVMNPTEGTILTVAREAASGAVAAAQSDDITETMRAAVKSGNDALAKTPDMLPALKQAGVVDSGGKGWMCVLEGILAYLDGQSVEGTEEKSADNTVVKNNVRQDIKYSYCTEFIVEKSRANVNVGKFRRAIENKGDCVLVIEDDEIVKVHIHTNHPGFVLEQAILLGSMINIKIDNMKHQHNSILQNAENNVLESSNTAKETVTEEIVQESVSTVEEPVQEIETTKEEVVAEEIPSVEEEPVVEETVQEIASVEEKPVVEETTQESVSTAEEYMVQENHSTVEEPLIEEDKQESEITVEESTQENETEVKENVSEIPSVEEKPVIEENEQDSEITEEETVQEIASVEEEPVVEETTQESASTAEEETENTDEISENTENTAGITYGFVAVANGEGFEEILKGLGINSIVYGGQTMNPSTEDILEAVEKADGDNIFVFPNNKNIIMAAEQSAELTEKNVIVLPTKGVPECISAMLVFDASKNAEFNTKNMTNAANRVKTGYITYAVRDTHMSGREIKAGDILGICGGHIDVIGGNVEDVCGKLISNMITDDDQYITVYYGTSITQSNAEALSDLIEEKYSDFEVSMNYGGQSIYYYIISVE